MRLKQLEIKGFKSFADKTVLNFNEGITGIIGPNGCGKSNIIDSIRWVIGEQKISALRSENLEALVFNGSKTRTASGLAEVSLTFENTKNLLPTEFSTVTVTRRFYKNGESEYRLNDVTCRLRDIHNLFLDTGVSNDSYAIIELGMVDDIIKDKDNSRRRMLEQAAGITIYKTRKKEAKQKLEATEADLNRIDDLLFEINNQLKILESQAKKAEKYHEVRRDYKSISIELAKASLLGFNLTYKNLTQQQQQEADKKALLEKEIAGAEENIETDKNGFAQQEQQLQQLQHSFNGLQQVIFSKESEKNLCTQRLHHLKEKEESIAGFLTKTESQQKNIEDSILYTTNLLQKEEEGLLFQKQKVGDFSNETTEKRAVLNDKKLATDKVREKQQQVQRRQFELEKNVAVSESSVQNIQRTTAQLQNEQQNRQTQIAQLEKEAAEKENNLKDKKQQLEQCKTEHEEAKRQILQTQSRLDELRNRLGEENRKLDARKNEHNLLKNLIDSMEGYPESIKFLHKNNEWNNQAPILSDIIYVQEAYRAAIENVLAPYLNYYVVNSLEEGMQAVQLLINKNKGKANFLLLNAINAESVAAVHQPENTIAALSVIEVDDPYKKLAAYLLQNVFIAENEAAFNNNSNGAIVLEKSGRFVKGKYMLTGGSTGSFEGKRIGRVQNLKKLADEIVSQQKIADELKEKIQQSHEDVIHLNGRLKEQLIRQTENEINQLTNALFALHNKQENLQSAFHSTGKQMEELKNRLLNEQASSQNFLDELAAISESLKSVVGEMKEAEENFKQAEQDYQKISGTYNEANVSFIQQQSKIAAVTQEITYKQNQLKELHTQIAENTARVQQVTEENKQMNGKLAEIEQTHRQLTEQKIADEQIVKQADQAYYQQRQQLQSAENELRSKIKTREITDILLAEIKDKLNDLKLQLAGMRERLMVEFKIEIDAIIDEERETELSTEELQATSDKLKKRIENMGEINPTAIEAFDEMKKRFDFITEQKNDLVSAKQGLLQTIQEVEETANQQFLTTFELVRENFQKVFKALFTEADTADLVLENPDNLAETGIDVIAKPKGKKPSSITQLSGGEKTLTATALLFAIYLIKPAPFCILDEVDAPLDDANVNKFTGMIQQFSENSQFIIVTHNKTTMSTVDVIYGVTMQEPGVSKLVPVDFRNLN